MRGKPHNLSVGSFPDNAEVCAVAKQLDRVLESKAWKTVSHFSTIWTFISVPVGAGVGIVLGVLHHHSLEWIFLWSGVGLVMGAVFGVSVHELWSRVGWASLTSLLR
jgi:hypothetical protein